MAKIVRPFRWQVRLLEFQTLVDTKPFMTYIEASDFALKWVRKHARSNAAWIRPLNVRDVQTACGVKR